MADLSKVYWAVELARALREDSEALRERAEAVKSKSRQLRNAITSAKEETAPNGRAASEPTNTGRSYEREIAVG